MATPNRDPGRDRYVIDLIERVVLTYAQAFLGLVIVDATDWQTVGEVLNTGRSAAIAALPAALSLAKGLIAKAIGNRDSASLAPAV